MKKAIIEKKHCVACGNCVKGCPKKAIKISRGITAVITKELCIGCGLCAKVCPASAIRIEVSA